MSHHSSISPSGFHANSLCLNRHNFSKGAHDIVRDEALKGTTAHELLDGWFKKLIPFEVGNSFMGENGMAIDADNIEHVKNTYRFIVEFLKDISNALFFTELQVDPGLKYKGESTSYGTSDIVIFDPDTGTIYVFDYKNGMMMVEIEDNYQLLLYALGCYYKFKEMNPEIEIKKVVIGILQPRPFHQHGPHRFQEIDLHNLLWKWQPHFNHLVQQIMKGGSFTPGKVQCRWCRKAGTCVAAATQALADARATFLPINSNTSMDVRSNVLKEPTELTEEQLRAIMESMPFVEGWLKAVREFVDDRFNRNKPLPGFKLVHGRGSRAWSNADNDQMYKIIGRVINLPKDTLFNSKLKSPAQFENTVKPLITKDQWKEINTKLIEKKKGKPTVVSVADKRVAIANDAKEVFQPIAKQNDDIDMSFLD